MLLSHPEVQPLVSYTRAKTSHHLITNDVSKLPNPNNRRKTLHVPLLGPILYATQILQVWLLQQKGPYL